MDNFIFSLNATMPVFCIIVIGNLLCKVGLFDEDFARKADKLAFQICIPLSVGLEIAGSNIREDFDLNFVLFCVGVTMFSIVTMWFFARMFVKDHTMIGAIVQGGFRSSAAVLGLAFVTSLYGNVGMTPLMIASTVPLYNIFSVLILSVEDPEAESHNRKDNIKRTLMNILKNPIIQGVSLGIFISYCSIPIPTLIYKPLHSMGTIATPLALLSLGATFKGAQAITKIKPTFIVSFIKLVLMPAIFLPIAISLGFRQDMLVAILIMLGAPTTVSAYIMAKNMHSDAVLTSSIIATTTLFSSVTLTFWIYMLRSMGLI